MLRLANLSLLILFPLSWFAPLLRAGLLPYFDLDAISVVTGLQALWEKDVILALLVTFLAIFAPYMKTIGLALVQFRLASPRILGVLHALGRIPAVGDAVEVAGLRIEVVDMDGRRIDKVIVTQLPAPSAA